MTQEALNAERRARLALEQRVGELQSRVRQQWAYPNQSGYPLVYRQIYIGSSNTLATIDGVDYKGLKAAFSLTSVPSLTPTSISATYADGLSAAYDLGDNPNAGTGPLVWVSAAAIITIKNPSGGADTTVLNTFQRQMVSGTVGLSSASYQVPVSASPGVYATVYCISIVGA